jgi:hypothetical protein
MSFTPAIHAWNIGAATVVGGVLNGLVLWMVARHTPVEMRPYSCVLQQTAISDLALLGLSEMIRPVSWQKNEYFERFLPGIRNIL